MTYIRLASAAARAGALGLGKPVQLTPVPHAGDAMVPTGELDTTLQPRLPFATHSVTCGNMNLGNYMRTQIEFG